jgi:RND family efflux transporter MFP subunit
MMDRLKSIIITTLIAVVVTSCTSDPQVVSSEKKADTHNHAKGGQVSSKSKGYYTCAMHPHIKLHEDGECPICGMDLTFVEGGNDFDVASSNLTATEYKWACSDYPDVTSETEESCPIDGTPMIKVAIKQSVNEIIGKVMLTKSQLNHFTASLFRAQPHSMTKKVRVLGRVIKAEENESFIPARVSGRVEKVYIKSVGQFVKKGQPVVELYSPALISAGEEYLIASKNFRKAKKNDGKSKIFKKLANQSKERLKLWGITDLQLVNWKKSGKVPERITVHSPTSGIIQKRIAREGKYFKEGQNFFSVVDLSTLWVELDIYEHDAGIVALEQKVSLTSPSYPGDKWRTSVDFVSPLLNEKNRTLKVRATIQNVEGKLKPGMILDADLEINLNKNVLVVPRSAIIDTGVRKVVWVALDKDKYIAKLVKTGFESNGFVEIKEGIKKDDHVVLEGNFLLDAQAQLFGGYHI